LWWWWYYSKSIVFEMAVDRANKAGSDYGYTMVLSCWGLPKEYCRINDGFVVTPKAIFMNYVQLFGFDTPGG
jgi:hypothetical protein